MDRSLLPSVPIIDQEDIERVAEVLRRGKLTSLFGQEVREFEKEFAAYYGAKQAIATSSGTAALHAAVEAAGISPGDEVITTPVTFIATANVILQNNAIPIFADVDLATYNISSASIRRKITKKTRAIIVVHFAGQPCEMDSIMEIARDHDLIVIEDCAHAHGAEYEGKKVGTIGDYGCFSLWESKNLGVGEGGIVITNDEESAQRVRSIINHGRPRKSPIMGIPPELVFVNIGYNYRMTEMQGALAIGQIRKLEQFNKVRNEVAACYLENLKSLDGLILPHVIHGVKHSWYLFMCRLDATKIRSPRDAVVKALNRDFGYEPAESHWSNAFTIPIIRPLYLQPVFFDRTFSKRSPQVYKNVRYCKGMCRNAELLLDASFDVPINHAMSLMHAASVAVSVKRTFTKMQQEILH